ncbi:MAG: hypothetical protein HY305_02930 [Sphingobacteriales bacterium]|nr:hypothetical protein [Sphingobacteriales bacterium]
MKQIFFTLTIAVSLLALASCCQKKGCTGADDINQIELYSFKANEVDSIIFESYTKESNFGVRVDSSFLSAHPATSADTTYILLMPKNLDNKLSYRIKMLSINKIYKLKNFSIISEVCNSRNYQPQTDNYNVLESYVVNDSTQLGNALRIKK